MFAQIWTDTLKLLRQPTRSGFASVARPAQRLALVYFLIGEAVALASSFLLSYLSGAERVAQRAQLAQLYGEGFLTGILDLVQNPLYMLAYAAVMVPVAIGLWVYLPYGVGRLLGGSKSLSAFVYVAVLCWVPMVLANATLSLVFRGSLSIVYLPLSILLDGMYAYGLFMTLRAVSGLSMGRALLALAAPVAIFTVLMAGVVVAIVFSLLSRLGR